MQWATEMQAMQLRLDGHARVRPIARREQKNRDALCAPSDD
jgi:hypothetical protein